MPGNWPKAGYLVAFSLGIIHVQWRSSLPALWLIVLACCASLAFWICVRQQRWLAPVLLLAFWLGAGSAYSVWRAQLRLADSLSPALELRPLTVRLRILALPRDMINAWSFEARVLSRRADGAMPQRVLLRWYAGPRLGPFRKPEPPAGGLPDLRPGQVWRMTIKLKRVHTQRNFMGFDYDAHLFAAGVRATGTVVGAPRLLADTPWEEWETGIERLRHALRGKLLALLNGRRYAPVIVALVLGDQNGIAQEDWKVFNLTGITHLVSISGSHITMLAALGSMGVFRLWGALRVSGKRLAERKPVQVASASCGLLIAGAYCLLAGWGVPAQRTFIMLAVVWLSLCLRQRISMVASLSVAAAVVLVCDPWAAMSIGFCLSFGAIATLMLYGTSIAQGRQPSYYRPVRALERVRQLVVLQLVMSFAMTPLLIGLFHQFSVISPVVNAVAIPVIGGMVTPLAILLAMLCATGWMPDLTFWLAEGIHALVAVVVKFAAAASQLSWATWQFAAPPGEWMLVGLAGLAWALAPSGVPARWLGLACIVPVLNYRPDRPALGDWHANVLDVGQGAAVVITTRQHTILFDTGLKASYDNDSGGRIIVPYLRAHGADAIDELVVSHSDLDHVGGLVSLLQQLPVRHAYASFSLPRYLRQQAAAEPSTAVTDHARLAFDACATGNGFVLDNVQFRFLHPDAVPTPPAKSDNDHSCVLLVEGRHHSLLLTGDIGAAVESRLVASGLLPRRVDVVMAPHHGSRGSSSLGFAQALSPSMVFAQAGYLNRYGHPTEAAMQRWRQHAGLVLDTIQAGAVRIHSDGRGLWINSARSQDHRYWDSF